MAHPSATLDELCGLILKGFNNAFKTHIHGKLMAFVGANLQSGVHQLRVQDSQHQVQRLPMWWRAMYL